MLAKRGAELKSNKSIYFFVLISGFCAMSFGMNQPKEDDKEMVGSIGVKDTSEKKFYWIMDADDLVKVANAVPRKMALEYFTEGNKFIDTDRLYAVNCFVVAHTHGCFSGKSLLYIAMFNLEKYFISNNLAFLGTAMNLLKAAQKTGCNGITDTPPVIVNSIIFNGNYLFSKGYSSVNGSEVYDYRYLLMARKFYEFVDNIDKYSFLKSEYDDRLSERQLFRIGLSILDEYLDNSTNNDFLEKTLSYFKRAKESGSIDIEDEINKIVRTMRTVGQRKNDVLLQQKAEKYNYFVEKQYRKSQSTPLKKLSEHLSDEEMLSIFADATAEGGKGNFGPLCHYRDELLRNNDPLMARFFYVQAAFLGNTRSLISLGKIFNGTESINPYGYEKNIIRAYLCFKMAEELGENTVELLTDLLINHNEECNVAQEYITQFGGDILAALKRSFENMSQDNRSSKRPADDKESSSAGQSQEPNKKRRKLDNEGSETQSDGVSINKHLSEEQIEAMLTPDLLEAEKKNFGPLNEKRAFFINTNHKIWARFCLIKLALAGDMPSLISLGNIFSGNEDNEPYEFKLELKNAILCFMLAAELGNSDASVSLIGLMEMYGDEYQKALKDINKLNGGWHEKASSALREALVEAAYPNGRPDDMSVSSVTPLGSNGIKTTELDSEWTSIANKRRSFVKEIREAMRCLATDPSKEDVLKKVSHVIKKLQEYLLSKGYYDENLLVMPTEVSDAKNFLAKGLALYYQLENDVIRRGSDQARMEIDIYVKEFEPEKVSKILKEIDEEARDKIALLDENTYISMLESDRFKKEKERIETEPVDFDKEISSSIIKMQNDARKKILHLKQLMYQELLNSEDYLEEKEKIEAEAIGDDNIDMKHQIDQRISQLNERVYTSIPALKIFIEEAKRIESEYIASEQSLYKLASNLPGFTKTIVESKISDLEKKMQTTFFDSDDYKEEKKKIQSEAENATDFYNELAKNASKARIIARLQKMHTAQTQRKDLCHQMSMWHPLLKLENVSIGSGSGVAIYDLESGKKVQIESTSNPISEQNNPDLTCYYYTPTNLGNERDEKIYDLYRIGSCSLGGFSFVQLEGVKESQADVQQSVTQTAGQENRTFLPVQCWGL